MSTQVLQDLMTKTESLPDDEKLRLAIHLLQQTRSSNRPRKKWCDLGGLAPDLLGGEDAQEWVSRTRREDTEHREALLKQ
jgi:hypothetical protein